MSKEEVIYQLENLQSHCEDMLRENKSEAWSIWKDDIEALKIAIRIIRKEIC